MPKSSPQSIMVFYLSKVNELVKVRVRMTWQRISIITLQNMSKSIEILKLDGPPLSSSGRVHNTARGLQSLKRPHQS